MERPLKELTLPSGKTAKIVTYLLRGEAKEIERKRWKDAKVVQNEDGTVTIVDVPVDQKIIQDDALVVTGLKYLKDGELEITSISKEIVDDLSSKDFDFILEELNGEITEKKSLKKT